jgi:hypothetical protein
MKYAVIDLDKRTVVAVEDTMVAATDKFYAVTTGRDRITSATVLPIADWLGSERLEVLGELCELSVVPALDRAEDRDIRDLMAIGIEVGYNG